MKNLIILLQLSLVTSLSYAFPSYKLYCNGELASKDSVSSYFLPVEYRFEFLSKDTIYQISEGTAEVIRPGGTNEIIPISSNYFHLSTKRAVRGSIKISIKKLKATVRGKALKPVNVTFNRTIIAKGAATVSESEAKAANYGVVLKTGNEILNDVYLTPDTTKTTWYISLPDTIQGTIKKVSVVGVRGNRPIFAINETNVTDKQIKVSLKEYYRSLMKDDFILIEVEINEDKKKFYSKTLIVK